MISHGNAQSLMSIHQPREEVSSVPTHAAALTTLLSCLCEGQPLWQSGWLSQEPGVWRRGKQEKSKLAEPRTDSS